YCFRELVAIECERRAAEQGERMRLGACEELLGLVQPALAPAQLAEPRERIADHRRPRRLEAVHGGRQLSLRLLPSTLPAQPARVVRPTRVEQEDVVLITELAHAGAPLGRSLVVTHALAS